MILILQLTGGPLLRHFLPAARLAQPQAAVPGAVAGTAAEDADAGSCSCHSWRRGQAEVAAAGHPRADQHGAGTMKKNSNGRKKNRGKKRKARI